MLSTAKLSRRTFLRLTGAMTGIAVLAACQPAVQPGQPAQEEAAAAPTEGPQVFGSGATEINYWNGFGGPDGATMTEMVKSFSAENPDITVKMQILPWDVFFDKLAAALVAGSGAPDLFVLWHSVVPQYAKPGHLAPLAEEMFSMGLIDPNDLSPALVNAVTVDGTPWTVPFDNYGCGVYVNTSLLKASGIDPNQPPADQAQFLDYARMLTTDKNGNHPGDSGFDPANGDVWAWAIGWPRATIQPALYQWGADIIDRADPTKVLINSEGAIAATQFFVDLVHTHNVAPIPAGFNDMESYANNKVAMVPNGSWMYRWFQDHKEIETILWPYPKVGDTGATIMWSHTFAMPKSIEAAKADAVKKLVKYLSDNSRTWTEQAGMPTARLSLREGLMDKVWTLPTFDKQFRAEGVMEFASNKFSEIMGAVEPEWSAALNKDKSVEEALNSAADRITRAIGS